jgi:hypothetical protein
LLKGRFEVTLDYLDELSIPPFTLKHVSIWVSPAALSMDIISTEMTFETADNMMKRHTNDDYDKEM